MSNSTGADPYHLSPVAEARVTELFRTRYRQLVSYARRQVDNDDDQAHDLVVEALMDLMRRPEALERPGDLRLVYAWTRTAIKHEGCQVRAHWKVRQKYRHLFAVEAYDAAPDTTPHDEALYAQLWRAMATLTAQQRRAITMNAQGFAIGEIATRANLSPGRVQRDLVAARAKLRQALATVDAAREDRVCVPIRAKCPDHPIANET